LDERVEVIPFTLQKGQACRAVRPGVHLLPELGIFPHPLEKFNAGFHGHPLTGVFGRKMKPL
jgi:hypothetical protein